MVEDNKALALKSENSLANMPMPLEDLVKDAQLGGEVGLKDIAIPYLYVLQTNSPQCNADSEKYIEGAKAGMFLLTVIDKVFDGRTTGVTVVPCYYERKIMEWIPREEGGGLVGSYPAEDPIMLQARPNEKKQMMLPNGHMLMDTAYHYLMLYDESEKTWTQCIMPLKSTALKVSRKLNSLVKKTLIPGTQNRAPRFLFNYQIKTVKEQKDTNVWSSPVFEQLGIVTKETYDAAKAYSVIAAQNLLARAPESTEHLENNII
jgi:hypothetical protein